MTCNELIEAITKISNRGWILYAAGEEGYFHLGLKGCIFLYAEAVRAESILRYVQEYEEEYDESFGIQD